MIAPRKQESNIDCQNMARYLDTLRRWARIRSRTRLREWVDEEDIVQLTLLRVLKGIPRFEFRGEEAFLAYLHRIFINQIRDENRRARRLPPHETLDVDRPCSDPSPLEALIRREKTEHYEKCLLRMRPVQRQATLLRLEAGLKYHDVARAVGLRSANSARVLVGRAIARLDRELEAQGP